MFTVTAAQPYNTTNTVIVYIANLQHYQGPWGTLSNKDHRVTAYNMNTVEVTAQ